MQADNLICGFGHYLTGPTTITQSGVYHLSNDIVGTIAIAANNVTLDLNNRALGVSGGVGISCSNQNNITIQNGILQNSNIHISVSGCTDLVVENVDFISGQTGIIFQNCLGASITDCNMSSLGNTGVYINTCTDVTVNTVQIFNSTLNFGIRTTQSNSISLNNIGIVDNTFSQGLNLSSFVLAGGILCQSTNTISIQAITINNNTFNQIGLSPSYALGIYGLFCTDIMCAHCDLSTNIFGNNVTLFGFIFDQSAAMNCTNCAVTANNCAFNGQAGFTTNRFFPPATQKEVLQLQGCSVVDNITSGIDCMQLNLLKNSIITDCVIANNTNVYFGIYLHSVLNSILTNCKAINNTGLSSGSGIVAMFYIDANSASSCIVSRCQAIQNSASTTDPLAGFGTLSPFVQNLIIENCISSYNSNTAGQGAGYYVSIPSSTVQPQVVVRNNTAVSNAGSTTVTGFGFSVSVVPAAGTTLVSVFGNQAQNHGTTGSTNYATAGGAYAIATVTYTSTTGVFVPTPTPYSNISVI